jgi:hypothetical protein
MVQAMQKYLDNRPARFRRSPRRQRAKANQLMKTQTVANFLSAVPEPYWFIVKAQDLGIPDEQAHPDLITDTRSVKLWLEAVTKRFKGVFYVVLEVGKGDFKNPQRTPIHANVVAASYDGHNLEAVKRDSRRFQKVTDLKGLFGYLFKAEAYTFAAHTAYTANRILGTGKAPRVRVWYVNQRRARWNQKRHPIALGPSNDIPPHNVAKEQARNV